MTNLEDNKKLEEWVLELGNKEETYEQCIISNLNAMNSILLNISRSLAIIADKLSEVSE